MEEAKSLLTEINRMRMNPQGAIFDIKQQIGQFDGPKVLKTSKGERLKVAQGKYVWTEAAIFLQQCKPRDPLVWCPQLCYAASEYQSHFNKGQEVSPFKLLKEHYEYNGNISFNISQCQAEQTLRETVISMVIDDGDMNRGNRSTIFETKYTHFGGFVTKRGKVTIAILFFADTSDFKVKIPGQISTSSSTTIQQKVTNSLPATSFSMLDLGRQLIYELNAIRRDPRKLIPLLKAQLHNFKQDRTLSKNGINFKTQQGKIPYLDLITELETLSPLPALSRSQGLSIATAQQVSQLDLKTQIYSLTTNHSLYLKKYTLSSQNTNNFIMNRTEGDKIIDLLIFSLVDDGDYNRTVRRKLLSPILKVAGAAVGNKYFAVDICEACKDNQEQIKGYLQRADKKSIQRLSDKIDYKIGTAKLQDRVTFGVGDSFSSEYVQPTYNYTSSYHPPSTTSSNYSNNYSSSNSYSNVTTSNVEGGVNPYTYGSTLDDNQPQSPRFGNPSIQKGLDNKTISKKTTKSSTSIKNGKTYKKIITKIQYQDGTISETEEEQIVH